ncbi:MAG: response regulator [Eubacterium sp.]|nr:response regulator [Eubacterium sp.]MBR1772934.1 response regulator [Eubacterium sp.]
MGANREKNDMFRTGNLVLLLGYTIFAIMHVVITFLLGWDKWVLFVIGAFVGICWGIHIKSIFTSNQRLWVIAFIMMINYFIYGVHMTSTYDLAIVMAAIMMLFIMTEIKPLITLCQITYYISMTYDLAKYAMDGGKFDILLMCRIIMHYSVITMLAYFLKTIINKWDEVEAASQVEIDQLTESTNRLNDFLANVSHEIRTPVNAIIGLTGICIDKEKDEDNKKNLEAVRQAGRRVSEQIGDILDFSEIDRGNIVSNLEDYMLSSAMNDLMNDIRDMKKEGVELVIDIDPTIPAVMNTDVTKLKKIIKALVSNGIKYTTEGGVYLKLHSERQDYGVNLCIEVSDTGIGMTEEELEKVYERFYQTDSSRTRTGSGLGLGLPIVSGFVSLLGGFMTITSKKDEGTTVRVSLPQKVVEYEPCASINEAKNVRVGSYLSTYGFKNPMVREFFIHQSVTMSGGLGLEVHRVENIENLKKITKTIELTHLLVGEEEYKKDQGTINEFAKNVVVMILSDSDIEIPGGTKIRVIKKPFCVFPFVAALNSSLVENVSDHSTIRLKGVHALVVDDEPMNLVVAKGILKQYGMEVSTATSGAESLEMCRDHEYDIIFMDHMMAGMDGVEAMKKIRTDVKGLNREIPIVALTANAMSSAKQMFISEGFDGFVSKPIEIEELERTMKRVLPADLISFESEEKLDTINESTEKSETDSADASAEIEESSDSIKDKLARLGIDIETGLMYCGGDTDLYDELILQFAEEASDKRKKLRAFYNDKDMKNYEIIIHAAKSTSKMIGAGELSDDAMKLEHAAHDFDMNYIDENHSRVIDDYKKITDGILEAYGKNKADEVELPDSDPESDEVMEFEASDNDEVFEFAASSEDEVMEFGPADDDEVLEFEPKTEE